MKRTFPIRMPRHHHMREISIREEIEAEIRDMIAPLVRALEDVPDNGDVVIEVSIDFVDRRGA